MIDQSAILALTKAESITAAAISVAQHADAVTALPNDYTVHDLEPYLTTRRRARGSMVTSHLAHFASYAGTYANEGAATFISAPDMKAVAVLNLGTQDVPGHADNTAELRLQQTAPYTALCNVNAKPLKQQDAAEFLEDWAPHLKCLDSDGEPIELRKAVAAMRRLTIESMKKVEAAEQQLATQRSAFESIQATSTEPIPAAIDFTCTPYQGLPERTLRLRLGIVTSDKPAVLLRIVNLELHREQMAEEMAALVAAAVGDTMPVHIGSYTAKR